MNQNILNFIYTNKKYIDYPEIIEFYTGIDRNKTDALNVMISDLAETIKIVRDKVKISDSLNPFKSIKWNPDIEALAREEAKIGENVIISGLPDEVKDKYDDKDYDQVRPYNQVISSVMKDYSFVILMRQISAASRALRNSDYVDSELKRKLLKLIVEGWNEVNKLLIVVSPLLAERGNVIFDGAAFYLRDEDFNFSNPREKWQAVLLSVPTNIVKLFKDDLYSIKIGPLLIDKAVNEGNSLLKHEMMLLIIAERPVGWHKIIDSYIVELDKNSFYLSDVLQALMYNVDYRATEISDKSLLKRLASKCRAKHIFKSDNPDQGLIRRIEKLGK